MTVNSVHYQGIATLAPELRIEALAPDGVIEAASAELSGSLILGVQWHPEWNTHDPASRRIFEILGQAMRGESFARRERVLA